MRLSSVSLVRAPEDLRQGWYSEIPNEQNHFFQSTLRCFEREAVAPARPQSIFESIIRCFECKSWDNVGFEEHLSVLSFTLCVCLASSVSWYHG